MRFKPAPFLLFGFILVLGVGPSVRPALAQQRPQLSLPVLKWQRGGCTSFCQTGWYSSPAVADLDRDGTMEVIWGASDVVAINGEDGTVQWRGSSGNRVWPGIAIADLTGDGTLEVIVGRNSNQLTVYQANGSVLWTRNPFSGGEVRSVAVADLENDGLMEIIVGRASSGSTLQMSVYEPDGTVRAGWPARHTNENGFGAGMYNENITVGDLNADGFKEIFGPTDTHYITVLDRNGTQLPANAIYGAGKVWSQVGVHVDHSVDLIGFANCGVEHRPNFANCAPAIGDLDGNGTFEFITTGDVYNCDIGDNEQGDLYVIPFVLNLDRTRWMGSGFDWTVIPSPAANATPLSEDFSIIENNVHNTVLADLDGDGQKEILYPSYDGRLHAYWLDKTQHGNWPFVVPGSGFRFASEPAVVDLDNDGHAEVIFTSWPQKGAANLGQLHILDYLANTLFTVTLPGSFPSGSWNGGLGAPTIANIDADPDMEIVVGTSSSGLVAYDMAGTANARILWGTGRGGYLRTGVPATSSDTPCVYAPASGAWFARYANSSGNATLTYFYGPAGAGWTPLSGDFYRNGRSTPALYVPASGAFFLRNANSNGNANQSFFFGPGNQGWRPIIGDWNGNGIDTVGLYDPTNGAFFLKNSNSSGSADTAFFFGAPNAGLIPLAGDWNGDGIDTIGLYNPATAVFFLRNSNTLGAADIAVNFGPANATPLVGDWNGDGIDTIGIYMPGNGSWFLKNTNTAGFADLTFFYGPAGATPVVGNWDGQ